MKHMIFVMFAVAAIAPGGAMSGQSSEPAADSKASCRYDRTSMLALDYQAFDQTPGRGWRALTDGSTCLIEAANLIRDYRTSNNLPHPMLYWHEGQNRAASGSVSEAVALMEQARPLSASIPGWNELVDATIAFLRMDRAAFDKAKVAMDTVPQARFAEAVHKLGRCFGEPYMQALACKK